jgi:hypothetical protein
MNLVRRAVELGGQRSRSELDCQSRQKLGGLTTNRPTWEKILQYSSTAAFLLDDCQGGNAVSTTNYEKSLSVRRIDMSILF